MVFNIFVSPIVVLALKILFLHFVLRGLLAQPPDDVLPEKNLPDASNALNHGRIFLLSLLSRHVRHEHEERVAGRCFVSVTASVEYLATGATCAQRFALLSSAVTFFCCHGVTPLVSSWGYGLPRNRSVRCSLDISCAVCQA